MSYDESLWYQSLDTSHYSYHCHSNNEISDEESIEVSLGDGIHGHWYLENSHSLSRNHGFYHSSDYGRGGSRSQDTEHSFSFNFVVYSCGVSGIVVNRSQENSHYSSHNCEEIIDVEGRVLYRSQTIQYSSVLSWHHGRLLESLVSFLSYRWKCLWRKERWIYLSWIWEGCDDVDGRRNMSPDDGYLRGDKSVDDGSHGSSSKEIIQFSSQNIG